MTESHDSKQTAVSIVKELMTWEHDASRWCKRYEGKRYRIGAKKLLRLFPDLATSESRAGTRSAANRWWSEKESELLANTNSDAIIAIRLLLTELEDSLQLARQLKDTTLVAVIQQRMRTLRQRIAEGKPVKGISLNPHAEEAHEAIGIDEPRLPFVERCGYELRNYLWQQSNKLDRVLPISLPAIADDAVGRSSKVIVDRYLEERKREVDRKPVDGAKPLSLGRYTSLRVNLNDFLSVAGEGLAIEELNRAEVLTNYHSNLLARVESGKISTRTAKDRIGTAKQFLRWCFEEEITGSEPRNLRSRKLQVTVEQTETVVFEPAELRIIIDAAVDRTKLFLLLMANCAFRQSDIADLRMRELDGDYIRHARVKTRKQKPPVVNYKLWPETRQLLEQHFASRDRSDPDAHVLLNEQGEPLKTAAATPQGEKYIDNIRSAYYRVLRKLDIPKEQRKPLSAIRATSSDLLKKYGEEIQTLFLGNKPDTITGKHYTATHNDYRLDEPLAWLREQYFGTGEAAPVVVAPNVSSLTETPVENV